MDRFCWKERPTPGEAFLVWLPTGEQVGLVTRTERSAPRVWDSYDLLVGGYVGDGPTGDRKWAMRRLVDHVLAGEISERSIGSGVWLRHPTRGVICHLVWQEASTGGDLALVDERTEHVVV